MLGLKRGVLALSPHCTEWASLYATEHKLLLQIVGDAALDIQHVGSTALPGMIAKPILDIAMLTGSLDNIESFIPDLVHVGYAYRGEQGIPGRHLFAKGDPVTHHLHVTLPGCDNWQKQIYFRDYLLAHQNLAATYADLKQLLVNRPGITRKAYSEGKSSFIERVLQDACKFYAS